MYLKDTLINPHPNESFTRMIRDEQDGKLYMAAVNNIYRISPDLTLEEEVRTGPKIDDPDCFLPPSFENCPKPVKYYQAYNKALLILKNVNVAEKRLISCSTLYHGACEKRHLDNLRNVEPDFNQPVVANIRNASTVAFIADGPIDSSTRLPTKALYVGSSYTNIGSSFRKLVPSFISRNITTYKVSYKGIGFSSSKAVNNDLLLSFPVNYVFGFSNQDFSYMITVQKMDTTAGSPFISKIVRVCQNDKLFYSYAEVELQCTHNGAKYNLVQTAYVGKVENFMAQVMSISTFEDVLFAVFSRGQPNLPSNETALCIYPMREVRKMFTKNIQDCFDGKGNTGPDHIINRNSPCIDSVSIYIYVVLLLLLFVTVDLLL